MAKITDIQIRHWIKAGAPIPGKAQGEVPGLTFTLSKDGTASWVLRYKIGGKSRELTLGRYPDLTIALAKTLAIDARSRIAQGGDPARDKRLEKIRRCGEITVKELCADYVEKVLPTLSDSTRKQRERYINKWVVPKLGVLSCTDVAGADVVAVIDVVGKGSVIVADVVFTIMNELFKYAIGRRIIAANPCFGVSVKAICGKPPDPREGLMLSELEIREIFRKLHTIGKRHELTVKILLGTCVRINELFKAMWDDIDLEAGTWLVPDENAKMGIGFTVPLSPYVSECFRQLQVYAAGSKYVLPKQSSSRSEPYMDARALNAQIRKLCSRLEGVREFIPHDLRSTGRSHITGTLGFDEFVGERCLNHVIQGVAGRYDKHDYLDIRRQALNRLSELIEACELGRPWIHDDSNIVQLRTAG